MKVHDAKMDAIILGGGRGTRLTPLTSPRAKPAVQIGGKYRLIDIPMSNCINSGIRNIQILTQFNTASLHRHIFRTYKFDSFSRGNVSLMAAQQTMENTNWFQGTADAVRSYWKDLRRIQATHYVILAGDHLYKMDYRDFLQSALDVDADIAIAAKKIPKAEAEEFGLMSIDENNFITDFTEKPSLEYLDSSEGQKWHKEGEVLISMGIYIFKKEVLEEALKFDGNDFGKNILPASIKEYKTIAHIFDGYWEDIGTIRSFFNANINLTELNPVFTFYDPDYRVFTRPRFLPGSRIGNGEIKNSLINDGCKVGHAKLTNSILGIRSIVGNDVEMENVYHMGADFYENEHHAKNLPPLGVGEGSKLKNVILDKNVRIGKNVVLENRRNVQDEEGDFYVIRDGIIVIPKGMVIPENTIL